MQQKSKPKPPSSSSIHKFSSSTATGSASSPDKQLLTSTPQQQPSVQKSNFEDWVGDEDDEYYYADRRDRGNKKKKKKNKAQERVWDWDDIYDPTLPNNYADYKGSEEQSREIRDWKARLYYHQMKEARKAKKNGAAYSDEEEERKSRHVNSMYAHPNSAHVSKPYEVMFAPPSTLNFAPPSLDEQPRPAPVDDDDDYYPPDAPSTSIGERTMSPEPSVAFGQPSMPVDATGEDAYQRRMQLSNTAAEAAPPTMPTAEQEALPTPPPPPIAKGPEVDMEAKRAEAQAKIAAFKAKLQKKPPRQDAAISPTPLPPIGHEQRSPLATAVPQQEPIVVPPPPPPPAEESTTTISRAPVRYQLPPAPANLPADEDAAIHDNNEQPETLSAVDQPKSSRPGQKGFAERLLKKYGWEKGQGLGAQGEGITTAIVAKAEKRKKLPDASGGGWAAPANMGKIVGGKKRKVGDGTTEADPRFGKMSEVIKLEGMLDGLDVQKEIEENDLMQEVGDEMGSKYGNVERVFIWRQEMGGKNDVFVKFTSQLSALRALNATDGMTFADNEVRARFWDTEMFEKGEYA